ncbi:MAG: archaeosortase/exosortase family protein [Crocinitomicaceae bacterium]|nr:archaeosortase/exosortase family protein [Crocinitomicaceae bacterium]
MRKLLDSKIVRFLLLGGVLYVVWLLIYYLLIKSYTNWDYLLNYNIVWLSQNFLDWIGFQTMIEIESDHVVIVMAEGDLRPILLGDECNGFKLFAIFSIFILVFPGSWKSKLWFIPLGLLIVHLANVIRVCSLTLINNYHPDYLDFNHLYTFTIFVYGIIFALWYWYAKKFSHYAQKK